MRQLITGLVAAAAVVTVSAAPAMACGGLFTQCGVQAYVSPCGGCGASYGYGAGYGAGYGYGVAERLPDPAPQYFYANQGPVYSGPGMYAPVPTYQESAVSGWGAYQSREAYYGGGYGGGYEGAHYAPAMEAPVVDRYQPHYYRPYRAHHNWYGYAPHRYVSHYGMHRDYAPHYSMRYGYHGAPRYYGQRVLRRYY